MREQWSAAEYSPQLWPEVVKVATLFHEAYRLAPPKLGRLDSDPDTRKIVELLTLFTPAQLERVCKTFPDGKWSKKLVESGETPRIGWLSVRSVRTALSNMPGERPISDNVKRALEVARRSEASEDFS